MRRWWLVVALLASLGINLGLVGAQVARARWAARWAGEEPMPGPDPGARLADRLRLAGEERERFLAQQRQLAESVRTERRELQRLRRELRAELIGRAPDRARVERLLAAAAERQAAIDRAFADNVLASRALLSGRQLELYLRFVERLPVPRPGEALRDRLRERWGPAPRDRPPGPPPPPLEGPPPP